MALLGSGAMILAFDMAPEALSDFDEWYTREHLPERLSVPGFLRGTRWTATSGSPRYFAMYEVKEVGILASPPYLDRLNSPTPWTTKMMAHFRGMTRGFCGVTGSFGVGLGMSGLLLRFKPEAGKEAALRSWLTGEILPGLAKQPGLTSAHLFESALQPRPTGEQSIRGKDAEVDWAILVTGYNAARVADVSTGALSAARLAEAGAEGIVAGVYQQSYALTDREAVQHA